MPSSHYVYQENEERYKLSRIHLYPYLNRIFRHHYLEIPFSLWEVMNSYRMMVRHVQLHFILLEEVNTGSASSNRPR
jgi:hypothetical protein